MDGVPNMARPGHVVGAPGRSGDRPCGSLRVTDQVCLGLGIKALRVGEAGRAGSLTWPCLQCSWKRWKPRGGLGSCSHSKAPGGGSRGRTGERGRPGRSPGPRALS